MRPNQKQVLELIKSISGQANILIIPRVFISITGEINAALLLSQCVYWSDKGKDRDGWFFKKYKEWEEEIGLTQYQVNRAAKKLVEIGLLETDKRKAMNAPTIHYKVNFEALTNLIMKKLDNEETSQSIINKVDNPLSRNSIMDYQETSQSLTEITTETTQEITTETTEVVVEQPQPNIFAIYEQEIGMLTPFIADDLKDLEKDFPENWFEKAVREAKRSTTRVTLKYVRKILERWKAEGLPTEYQDIPQTRKGYQEVWVNGILQFRETTA